MKFGQIFVFLAVFVFAISCTLTPDYVGTWVDDSTIPGTVVTADFKTESFILTIDKIDPESYQLYSRVSPVLWK